MKTISIDFDGVIHAYSKGWHTGQIYDEPVPGAISWLLYLTGQFHVQIYSTRSNTPAGIAAMKSWLNFYIKQYVKSLNLPTEYSETRDKSLDIFYDEDWVIRNNCDDFYIEFPTEKPLAFVSIDDRAIRFDGNFPSAEQIQSFKAWWEK